MSARKPASSGDVDALLAGLADPARRRTVELLGEAPRRASELARLLDLSAPAMSRHLRALKQSGLVSDRHPDFDARVRIYSLNAGRLAELRGWLGAAEAGWSEQLAAFRRHIEAKGGKQK